MTRIPHPARGGAPILLLGLIAVAIAAATGSWWILRLKRAQRNTTKRLQETVVQLETKGAALSMLEDEHHQLSEAYDTLKARWAETDQALQQLTQTSGQMKTELAALSTERSSLQRQVAEAAKDQQALQRQLASLREQVMEEGASRAAAEAELDEIVSRSLTPAEAEQLSEAFARQQQEETALQGKMATLSQQLAQLAQEIPEPAAGDAAQGRNPRQQAARYRQLGEFRLATYQYPQAAEAFERSLTYQDDPMVHAKLAFIYTRFIPNPQKAEHHAAHAPPGYPAQLALESTAGVQGLPRSSRKLFWDWLTQ